VFVLRQGTDGVPVTEICRKAGISQTNNFNWNKECGGISPPEMWRPKQLEDENPKMKRIVADRWLEKVIF
jgi:putative transposase